MLAPDQRRQVYALKGKVSPADCAEKVGCSVKTVRRMWANPKPVVDKPLPRVREKRGDKNVDKTEMDNVHIVPDDEATIRARDAFCSAEFLRGEMVANLIINKSALERAVLILASNPEDTDAIRTIAQISKTVQNALEDLAKWIGLDKGEKKQKEDAETEISDIFSDYAESA